MVLDTTARKTLLQKLKAPQMDFGTKLVFMYLGFEKLLKKWERSYAANINV